MTFGKWTPPARRLAALSVLLITVTILLAGCGGSAGGVSSGLAPYLMALWLFGISVVSLFFTGCGNDNNSPNFALQNTSNLSSSSSSSSSGGVQQIPTSLQFANTPGSIAQPVSHSANALTPLPPVVVEILDQNGNLDTSATNPVTISLGNNPSNAKLSGTLTVNAVAGIATFTDLEISFAGAGFTLVASSPGLTGATSAAFNVGPLAVAYGTRQQFLSGAALSYSTSHVSQGDFNGDGKMDLAFINAADYGNAPPDDSFSVLLGNGDGTFGAPRVTKLPAGPYGLDVGDFNGDGKADIAVAIPNASTVSVILSNGDGTFQSAVNLAAGPGVQSVLATDVNKDGHTDLVVGNGNPDTISVLLGNGDGSFQAARNTAVLPTSGNLFSQIASADFNGDGKPDLAIGAGFGDVQIFTLIGNGDGTFQAPQSIIVGGEALGVAVGDFNGDGHIDIAASSRYTPAGYGNFSNHVSIFLGNGDGTFQAAQNFQVGFEPCGLALGDVNGDGVQDLIVNNYYAYGGGDSVSVLLGTGNSSLFQTATNFTVAPGSDITLVLGDFNGDGKLDVATPSYYGHTVTVLLNKGDGTFPEPPQIPLPGHPNFHDSKGTFPTSVALGDLDNDGNLDMVLTGYYGDMSVFKGNGDGTFGAPTNYSVGTSHTTGVTLADVNGDGKTDALMANYNDGTVAVLLGNGDGTFQAAKNYPANDVFRLAVGDFNGDGKVDVAVTGYDTTGYTSVLLGNGDGSFQTAQYLTAPGAEGGVATADINGDGKLDLVVTNYSYYSVGVLLGNGDGTFQAPVNYNTASNGAPLAIAVGDFNGDGKPDIAVDTYYGMVSVLINNGDGTFQSAVNYQAAGLEDQTNMVAVDINRDGTIDLITADYKDNSVSILIGNGDGTFQGPYIEGTGDRPKWAAVGDLNNDGKPDIVTADYYDFTVTTLIHK